METALTSLESKAQNLENRFNETGKIYSSTFNDVELTANSLNDVTSLTLPAGSYVISASAIYTGNSLRWLCGIHDKNNQNLGLISSMDNVGYCYPNISTVVNSKETQTYFFTIYPSSINCTMSGGIRAVRIGD